MNTTPPTEAERHMYLQQQLDILNSNLELLVNNTRNTNIMSIESLDQLCSQAIAIATSAPTVYLVTHQQIAFLLKFIKALRDRICTLQVPPRSGIRNPHIPARRYHGPRGLPPPPPRAPQNQ